MWCVRLYAGNVISLTGCCEHCHCTWVTGEHVVKEAELLSSLEQKTGKSLDAQIYGICGSAVRRVNTLWL